MADKIDDQGFLRRWSERKLDADNTHDNAGDDAVAPELEPEVDAESEAAGQPPADLPDVETLDADSDYTGFLGDNVPEDLAKLALRKLWRSDPVLANLDGLNDYDQDFSKLGAVTGAIKTAYKVGRGFLDSDDECEDEAAPAATSEAPTEESGEAPGEKTADAPGDAPTDAPAGESDEEAAQAQKDVALSQEDEMAAAEFHNAELIKRD